MKKATALRLLQDLPGILKVTSAGGDRLLIQTADGSSELHWDGRSALPGRRALADLDGESLLLGIPHMPSGVGARLRDAGVNYIDESGNLYLQVDRVTIWLDGRTRRHAPPPSSELRAAGYRVLGGALQEPELFQRSIREIAGLCGVSTSPVLGVRDFLKREGCLAQTRAGPVVVDREKVLERWLLGYRDLLRRRLVIGRYALPESMERLTRTLDATLAEGWAWGGSQAALRRFSLGMTDDVIVHLPVLSGRSAPRVPLREDAGGPVEVLAVPFSGAWGGRISGAVGPLLQLAELASRHDDRSMEVAASLREHVLSHWHWRGDG